MQAITIRQATHADLAVLLAIYNYEIEHGVATFDTEPKTWEERKVWLEAHNRPDCNHPLLVAVVNGATVGYASLSTYNAKAAYTSTVELSVYVSPAARGKGVGAALMEAIIEEARCDERTHLIISLITGTNEVSVALHKKFGFTFVGTMHEVGYKHGRYLDVHTYELKV